MKTAVIGAGLMGRNLARAFAAGGHAVTLYDSVPAALAAAQAALADTPDAKPIAVHADLASAVVDAEFVIEAIIEDLEQKQALFERLETFAPSKAILASNSSVLPITQIAARVTRHPERCVGAHWWNPPELIPIVEVVRGARTSDAVMDATVAFLADLGKLPVRVERDVPGFIGNRLQHALWREAISLVADGVCTAEAADLVVRNTLGLRLGVMAPLENADYVGLDLTLAIHEAVLPSLNRDPAPSPLLREMVAAGTLGAKSGQGFFPWPAGAREQTAARMSAHLKRQLADRERRDAALLKPKEV